MVQHDSQENLIRRVLSELQERLLVNKKRKLVHRKESPVYRPAFHVKINFPFRPSIAYRFGNCAFDEDSLRFILLHEEKHIRSPFSWMMPTALITVDVYVLVQLLVQLAAAQAFLMAFFILGAIWYGSMPLLRYGEVRADLWSAQKLKSDFGIRAPSKVAFKALDWPDALESRTRKAIRQVILGAIHPSKAKRVARIAEEVDDYPGDQDEGQVGLPLM